jgi:hypothetical protein
MRQCHLPVPALIVTSNTTSYIRSYPAQKLIYCPSVVNIKKGGSYGKEEPTYWSFVAVWRGGVNILQGVVTHVALICFMVVSHVSIITRFTASALVRGQDPIYSSGFRANISFPYMNVTKTR